MSSSFFTWSKDLRPPQPCANCGVPGAANLHSDIPPPGLLCDHCLSKYRVMCDFCFGPVAWEYPCSEFTLYQYQYKSTENWLACERCAALINADDYDTLCKLAIKSTTGKGIIAQRALLDGFRKHRKGDPWRIDEQGNRAAFII